MKTKEWYTAEEVAELCNISTRTIERKRKELMNDELKRKWFKTKSKPFRYKYSFLSEFLNEALFGLIKRNRQLANTIECFKKNDSLQYHLTQLEWDFFVTLAYEENINQVRCFNEMHKAYELIEFLSKENLIRLFFTTEPFSNRNGYHNHFTIKTTCNKKELEMLIQHHLPKARIDIRDYDNELAGVFYVCKEGLEGEDWDLLGNQLKEEGIKLKGEK